MKTELKVSDLRIGNYVNNFNKVYSIRNEFVECFGLSFSGLIILNENDLKPIPLTEDMLLKCGFYKDEFKKESKNHSAFYSINHIDYKYSFAYADFRKDWGFYHSYTDACNDEDNNKFDFISCGIKYLHQLQNLYFALTNEELTINHIGLCK
jgi:hypothetical protein